jgi:hypothetical protein
MTIGGAGPYPLHTTWVRKLRYLDYKPRSGDLSAPAVSMLPLTMDGQALHFASGFSTVLTMMTVYQSAQLKRGAETWDEATKVLGLSKQPPGLPHPGGRNSYAPIEPGGHP